MEIKEVIKMNVLRFLPAKSLCRFKAVCKDWNQWISFPFFAHQQSNYHRSIAGFFSETSGDRHSLTFISLFPLSHGVPSPSLTFLPEYVTVKSSSNGLLCCRSQYDDVYFICNPATKEWEQLRPPALYHSPATATALAFDPAPYNFRSHFLVVAAVPISFEKAVYFEIFSSRTNSWRIADSEYSYAGAGDGTADDLSFKGDGVYINGVVYWETSDGLAIAFDVKSEQHGDLRLPVGAGDRPAGGLVSFHGELCYIMPDYQNGECFLEVYGDNNMVLKHRISVDLFGFRGVFEELQVLAIGEDDDVAIVLGNSLIVYSVKERGVKFVKEVIAPAGGFQRFMPYVNGLVAVCPVDEMPVEM